MAIYTYIKKTTPTKTTSGNTCSVVYIHEHKIDTSEIRSTGKLFIDYRAYCEMADKFNSNLSGFKLLNYQEEKITNIEHILTDALNFSAANLFDELKIAFATALGCEQSELEIVTFEN